MESVHGQMDGQGGQDLAVGPREVWCSYHGRDNSTFVCGKQRCCRVGTLVMQDTEGLSYRQEAARFRALSEHIPAAKAELAAKALVSTFQKKANR